MAEQSAMPMRKFIPLELGRQVSFTHNAPITNKLPDATLRGALPLTDGRTLIIAELEDGTPYGVVCRQPQVLQTWQTQQIIDEFTRVNVSAQAGITTINKIGGGARGKGLTAFHDIVEGDIENKAYVRPPLAVRRGLKVIDDFETEEGVD
jgi:hypothetical protein